MNSSRLPRQFDFWDCLNRSNRQLKNDDLKELLRRLNLKVTPSRLKILKNLTQLPQRHFSTQDLYEKVHNEDPTIGFATVWRLLKTLVQAGYVTETKVGNGPSRYEWNSPEHHDHLTCLVCGKIVEFSDPQLESLQESIAQKFGFKLQSHVMELYGICADCQKALKMG